MRVCRTTIVAIAALSLWGCDAPRVNRAAATKLETEANVELTRYLGRWYEIARFPNEFEERCVAVTADYSLRDDGSIAVVNRCRKGELNGPLDVAEGLARVVDTTSNAKLAVSFFWPFEGDYWILAVADDYSWALVGEPSGRYLWVLARKRRIDEALKQQLTARLAAFGYNVDALYWTPQPAD